MAVSILGTPASFTGYEKQKKTPTVLACVTRCSKRNLDGLISLSLYSTFPIWGSGGRRVASSSAGQTSQFVGGLVPGSNRSRNESIVSDAAGRRLRSVRFRRRSSAARLGHPIRPLPKAGHSKRFPRSLNDNPRVHNKVYL